MIDGDPGAPFEDEVVIRRLRWSSDETGFAVVDADREGDDVVLVGTIAHLEERERVRIAGVWQDDKRFGMQVKVRLAEPVAPSGDVALMAYLKRVKHIGGGRAAKLLERYGEGVLEAIDADPAGAFRVAGLNPKRTNEAIRSWNALRSTRALHLLLAPHGLAWLVPRIAAEYGDRAHEMVRGRPYELTSVFGVGFHDRGHDRARRGRAAGLRGAHARRGHPRADRGRARGLDVPAGRRARDARRDAARRPGARRGAAAGDARRRTNSCSSRDDERGLGLPPADRGAGGGAGADGPRAWPSRKPRWKRPSRSRPRNSSPHPSSGRRCRPRSARGCRSSPAARAPARPRRSG